MGFCGGNCCPSSNAVIFSAWQAKSPYAFNTPVCKAPSFSKIRFEESSKAKNSTHTESNSPTRSRDKCPHERHAFVFHSRPNPAKPKRQACPYIMKEEIPKRPTVRKVIEIPITKPKKKIQTQKKIRFSPYTIQ